ncbi:MAG: hypothetical protein LBD51_08910, partial [Bifidobacteriaceae bacterium]|nr:hypothetical protein [Bifidobacteriaceae bacterium]
MASHRGPGLLLGLGCNVDYELRWDQSGLQRQVAEAGLVAADLAGGGPIADRRGLLAAILAHMADGSGAEHRLQDPD